MKGVHIKKEEIKLSLFKDDMIIYIENPLELIRILLQLISEYSKVTEYKSGIQKSTTFLYTNTK